jgi:uncharacterized protein (DUF2147 family)
MGRRVAAFLLASLAWPAVGVRSAEASSVNCNWMIRNLVLNIFDFQHTVCGRIVWVNDPKRRPSLCGKTIVWGLASEGSSKWTNGWILDPDDGKTYHLSASLDPDGSLRARIYKGLPLFGKTEVLKRLAPNSLAGQC